MKIALLGTGFGRAHAAVDAERADVDEVLLLAANDSALYSQVAGGVLWLRAGIADTWGLLVEIRR